MYGPALSASSCQEKEGEKRMTTMIALVGEQPQLISLQDYEQGTASLSQKDSETLLAELGKIMKVGIS